jgi:hypothetical protein
VPERARKENDQCAQHCSNSEISGCLFFPRKKLVGRVGSIVDLELSERSRISGVLLFYKHLVKIRNP